MIADETGLKKSLRGVVGWLALGALAVGILFTVGWFVAAYLKEHSRISALVDGLGSTDPAVQEEAEVSLFQVGSLGRIILEGIAQSSPHRAECLSILEELRRPSHSAVLDALIWLARHQNPDGSWRPKHFSACCTGNPCCRGAGEEEFAVGMTGLSLLAYLGFGYSHLSHDVGFSTEIPRRPVRFGRSVKKALQWLLAQQSPDGSMGARTPQGMLNHAIATLALSEAYGMTASQPLKDPAQRAIDFLVAAQDSGGGWGSSDARGQSSPRVTGWAVWALYSAELSELRFSKETYVGALAWYEGATDPASGRVGFAKSGSPDERGGSEACLTTTAQGVLARIFLRKTKKDPALGAVHLLAADGPEWKSGKIDFSYWHFGGMALFQFDGPNGPLWKRWGKALADALIPQQKRPQDGCANGSWDPEGDPWAHQGGRVYATAINALTLENVYRYANVFGSGGKGR